MANEQGTSVKNTIIALGKLRENPLQVQPPCPPCSIVYYAAPYGDPNLEDDVATGLMTGDEQLPVDTPVLVIALPDVDRDVLYAEIARLRRIEAAAREWVEADRALRAWVLSSDVSVSQEQRLQHERSRAAGLLRAALDEDA
jgi:hypothetical protein